MTRAELRIKSAEYLNALSRDQLFDRFEITRVAEITGLDVVGIPVYSTIRPASKTISVSSGKSRLRQMARAGAIAEAIEFHTFENHCERDQVDCPVDIPDLPTQADSKWVQAETLVRCELVTHYQTKSQVRFPSELIAMSAQKESHWMRSSNGCALGASLEDALCAGLYELVERDQAALRREILDKNLVHTCTVRPPESLQSVLARCQDASLKMRLILCNVDLEIPVYWALLNDPCAGAGAYLGWGCHLTHEIAMERAMLEAIQGRCVYISGARDDILRREFALKRETLPALIEEAFKGVPEVEINTATGLDKLSVEDELEEILWRLGPWKDKIYFKHKILEGDLYAVRVVIPGLEQPVIPLGYKWKSMGRLEKLRQSITPALASTDVR